MKDDYYIANIEYNYYENRVLHFFDSCSGYSEDFEDGIITAAPIISAFDDFIKNQLIPYHTLPVAETIIFLNDLLKLCTKS